MELSRLLKCGSDLWLNTPKMFREASGTSGMTAAMNGSVNLSIPDGWIPEFSKHGKIVLSFHLPKRMCPANRTRLKMTTCLRCWKRNRTPVLSKPKQWIAMVKQSMEDVVPMFDSNRMAHEYYEKLYATAGTNAKLKRVRSWRYFKRYTQKRDIACQLIKLAENYHLLNACAYS